MNDQQRSAAASNLELLDVSAPHTDKECRHMLQAHKDWMASNADVTSPEIAKARAERGSLGYMAAIEEAANEVKANRF